jgi:hypothetical protein
MNGKNLSEPEDPKLAQSVEVQTSVGWTPERVEEGDADAEVGGIGWSRI